MNDHDLNQIYRPRSFSEVVGNARTKQKLINFITSGAPPQGNTFVWSGGNWEEHSRQFVGKGTLL